MSNMNVSEALAAFRRERVVSAADWTPAVTTQLKEWMLDQVTENRARVAAVVALARSGLVGELEEIDGAVSHLAKRLYEAEAVAEDLASEAVYAWLGMSTRPAGGTGKVECGEADLGRKPDKMALLRGHIRRALEDANYLDDDDLEKAKTMAKSMGMDEGDLMWIVQDVVHGVEEQDVGRKPDKMALFRGYVRRSVGEDDDLYVNLEEAETMAKSIGMDEGDLMWIVQDVVHGVEEQDVGRKPHKMALLRGHIRRSIERVDDNSIENADDLLDDDLEKAKTMAKSMGMDEGELTLIVQDLKHGN